MKKFGLYFAWLIALVATIGSLLFEEIKGQHPCVLCWYQRILMFPLAIILGIAAFRHASRITLYVIPLSALGFFVALYHFLSVTYLPETLSCTICKISSLPTPQPATFPLLSLNAFTMINAALIWVAIVDKRSKKL